MYFKVLAEYFFSNMEWKGQNADLGQFDGEHTKQRMFGY